MSDDFETNRHSEVVDLFRQAMEQAGIVTQDQIVADDAIHRFPVEGDKPGRKNGWYTLHLNPYPVGSFGAWNRDGRHTWVWPLPKSLSREDRTALDKNRIQVAARLEAEIAARQAKARGRAEYTWNRATPAPAGHPYLRKKQIKPNGAKLYRRYLVLPVRDMDGTLHSIQLISPSGEKRFLSGGRTSGCCYELGPLGKRIYITEGFATGATIHEVSGQSVAISFYAGNLKPVATALHNKYPEAELIIAADNDQWTANNPGQAKAFDAAKAVKAKGVLPRFRDTSTRPTDFNDLFLLEGTEEVRGQLEPMRLCAVLDALVAYIRRFVFMSESQARVVALWVAHTHAFSAADATPYLAVTSAEKRSGKTRLFEVLETVVANPWSTGRVTAAVLTRKIDAEHPSLLLDETDAAFAGEKDYAEALRGVLNTGHRRGGKASCCVGQGASISYRDFSTFCPKAIAGIGKLPDTVSDRAIPIRLKRARPGERAERFRLRKVKAEADLLRAELETWAAGATEGLRDAEPVFPEELTDRQQDGAEPLLAIADAAGGAWPQAARAALIKLCTEGRAADDSDSARLLADIRQIFEQNKADRLASSDLVEALAKIETSPWGEWQRGKPLSPTGLATLLRPFEISPRGIRIGESTPKGYLLEDFQDAFQRYARARDSGSSPSPAAQNATPPHDSIEAASGQFSKRNAESDVAAQKRETPNKDAVCGGVALSAPSSGAEAESRSEPKPFVEGLL